MGRLFSYRCLGLLFFLSSYFPVSLAQTLRDDQKQTCQRNHENDQRCSGTVQEFNTDHELLRTNASNSLDFPFGDTKALINKLASQAVLVQIELDLKVKAEQAALQIISTSAAVNQTGGAPTANGSTSLVSKPTTTDFISIAAESGAFTDTLNGTTMTLQANALGLTKYFANNPVFERWDHKYADWIRC